LKTPNLSRSQAAGVEQVAIEHVGIENLENARNEIAQDSKSTQYSYESAVKEAQEVLVRNPKVFEQLNPGRPAAATNEFQETVTMLSVDAVPPEPLVNVSGGGSEVPGDGPGDPVPAVVPGE
jgi:hypothetical protein